MGSSFPSGGQTTRPVLPRRSLTTWCVVCIKSARAASQQRSVRRMQKRERPDSDGSSSIFKQIGDADRRWRRTARASVSRSQRWPVRLPLECRCWRKQGVTERPSKPDRQKHASAFRWIWAWKTQQHWRSMSHTISIWTKSLQFVFLLNFFAFLLSRHWSVQYQCTGRSWQKLFNRLLKKNKK